MVESELGVPFEDVYELVEPEPIAAASIGQASPCFIHRAIIVRVCTGAVPQREVPTVNARCSCGWAAGCSKNIQHCNTLRFVPALDACPVVDDLGW